MKEAERISTAFPLPQASRILSLMARLIFHLLLLLLASAALPAASYSCTWVSQCSGSCPGGGSCVPSGGLVDCECVGGHGSSKRHEALETSEFLAGAVAEDEPIHRLLHRKSKNDESSISVEMEFPIDLD